MIALRRSGSYSRSASSPPSPVLDLPPSRFIAMASVWCASRLIEPYDIAPVENRLTISLTGSTSSIGTGVAVAGELQQPAQRHQPLGLGVDVVGVLLEDVVATRPGRVLQPEHGLRVEQVRLALAPPLVLPADRQQPVGQRDAVGRVRPQVPRA